MKRDWRRLASPLYLVGLVLLLAAAAWYVVNRRMDIVIWIALGLAAVALAGGGVADPERVRRALRGRQARYGGNMLLISLAFVGILGLLNYLAFANPLRSDLTEDQVYTLSPESRLTLSALSEPVMIRGFYTPEMESSREGIRLLLEQYRVGSGGLIAYEFTDPVENPLLARQMGIERDGALVVQMGERSEVLPLNNEQEITGALIRLSNPAARNVYFLTGHGERDIEEASDSGYAQIRTSLEAKNYTVGALNLLADPEVPEGALAVVIAGPTAPLSQEEVDSLRAYLEQGGSLVVLLQPNAETDVTRGDDALIPYLAEEWGISAQDDLIVEPRSSSFLVAVSFGYADHPVTARMQNLATLFPGARSLLLAAPDTAGVSPTALVTTSDIAWGETDMAFLEEQVLPEYDEASDAAGPLPMVALAQNATSGARVVVFGDADFGSNGWFQQLGNRDLLVNSIDWASEQEDLIDLTPRPQTERFVVPPSVQVQGLILLTTVILIPGAVVVSGIVVWWNRRKRA